MAQPVTTLPQLITQVTAMQATLASLQEALAQLRVDHEAFKAEQMGRRTSNNTRLGDLETYAQNNSRRIDEMEIRYNRVVDEISVIADNLTSAVAELAETDEVSGWRQWKEQQRTAGKSSRSTG